MGLLDPFYSDAIMGFEGFAPQAAWDYKQYTNGYGTKALAPGETIDKETAKTRFDAAIEDAAKTVDGVIPTDTPPGARAALISLTFNAGPGWTKSGLGDLVRSGNWDAAQQRIQEYNKAGGQVNPGLVNRRQQEAAWFNQAPGLPPAQSVAALPPTTAPVGSPPALQKPLPPQPLNLAQPMGNLPSFQWSPPQQQAAQQASPQPMALPPQIAQAIRQPIDLARLQTYLSQLPVPIRPYSFRG